MHENEVDISELEDEVDRLYAILNSYNIQKMMTDDVNYCERVIRYLPKEIKKLVDYKFKHLRKYLLREYKEEIIHNASGSKNDEKWKCSDMNVYTIISELNNKKYPPRQYPYSTFHNPNIQTEEAQNPWFNAAAESKQDVEERSKSKIQILPESDDKKLLLISSDTNEMKYGSYENITSTGKIIIPKGKNKTTSAYEIIPISNVVNEDHTSIPLENIEKGTSPKDKIIEELLNKYKWSDIETNIVVFFVKKSPKKYPSITNLLTKHVYHHNQKEDLHTEYNGEPFTLNEMHDQYAKHKWKIEELAIVMNIEKKYPSAKHLMNVFHNNMTR